MTAPAMKVITNSRNALSVGLGRFATTITRLPWESSKRWILPLLVVVSVAALGLKVLEMSSMIGPISKYKKIERTYNFMGIGRAFLPQVKLTYLQEITEQQFSDFVSHAVPKRMKNDLRWKSIVKHVLINSEKYQIDPFWVLSIMKTESHFDLEAKSYVGAKGLMQVMPQTASFLKSYHLKNKMGYRSYKGGLYNHVLNIELGAYYLAHIKEKLLNNHRFATVGYNMGPYWVKKRIRRGLPVGTKNLYFTKVIKNYTRIIGPFFRFQKAVSYRKVDTFVEKLALSAWSPAMLNYIDSIRAWIKTNRYSDRSYVMSVDQVSRYVLRTTQNNEYLAWNEVKFPIFL